MFLKIKPQNRTIKILHLFSTISILHSITDVIVA
nr:MAG TPA: hypothetical protein [Bacteriophage sp.]